MKTITNILISHAIFLALFGTAAYALAETDTPTTTRPRQAQFENRPIGTRASTTDRQLNADERRAQAQTRVQERTQTITTRIDGAIAKLQSIIERFDSRIEKLASAGVDTTATEASLTEARRAIDTAIAERDAIADKLATALASDDIRSALAEVKTSLESIRTQLQTARDSLHTALETLKEAVVAAGLDTGVSPAVRNDARQGTTSESN